MGFGLEFSGFDLLMDFGMGLALDSDFVGFSCVNFALIFLWVFVHCRFMVVVVGCYRGGGVGCCGGG